MAGVSGGCVLRPFSGVADHDLVEALWLTALEARWPLLPRAIAMVRDGFFAVESGRTVGCVALDLAGSIPLLLVAPEHQRRGIGTDLLSAALGRLRAAGVSRVDAGSGGTDCIWPGVPADLPEAARLFANYGWRAGHDTLDLVADLPDYRSPALVPGSAAAAGVTIMLATAADVAAVMAFETATFPNWARWFRAGNRDILLARDGAGAICATLLLDGPGADTVFEPMLGRAAGRPQPSAASGSPPTHKDEASEPPSWHARRRYFATAVPAPATSDGPSASRSTPARDTGPGAATTCSARAPALTRLRLPHRPGTPR
jgi:GNAT superfamily N-acetyltransferase